MDRPRSTSRTAIRATPSAAAVNFTPALRQLVIADALAFLAERYALDQTQVGALAQVPIRWKRARGASAFYPRAARGFKEPHIRLRVPPGGVGAWHTYRRSGARFSTPRGGVELPVRTLATVILIHEFTHALQHGIGGSSKRRFSEVETTGNEIEFIRRTAPAAFALLVPIERKRARRAVTIGQTTAGQEARVAPGQPRVSLDGSRPTGLAALRAIILRFGASVTGLVQPGAPAVRRPPSARATATPPRSAPR